MSGATGHEKTVALWFLLSAFGRQIGFRCEIRTHAGLNQGATADIISCGLFRAYGRPGMDAQADGPFSCEEKGPSMFKYGLPLSPQGDRQHQAARRSGASWNPPCGHEDGVMLLPPGSRCEVRKGGIKPSQADTSKNVGWNECSETLGSSGDFVTRGFTGVKYSGS